MVRGKYAARAANTIAHTENELLREKSAECEKLRAECDRLKLDLQAVNTTIGSRIIRGVAESSRRELAAANARVEAAERAHTEDVERIFKGIGNILFTPGARMDFPNLRVAEISELFNRGPRAGELLVELGPVFRRRDYIRRDAKVFRMIAEHFDEVAESRQRRASAPDVVPFDFPDRGSGYTQLDHNVPDNYRVRNVKETEEIPSSCPVSGDGLRPDHRGLPGRG